jgi:hypothetical protein
MAVITDVREPIVSTVDTSARQEGAAPAPTAWAPTVFYLLRNPKRAALGWLSLYIWDCPAHGSWELVAGPFHSRTEVEAAYREHFPAERRAVDEIKAARKAARGGRR